MDNRTNRLQVRLTDEERDRLDATANEQGLAPSAYARAEIIKACKRDSGNRSATLEELRAMRERGELVPTKSDAPIYATPGWFWGGATASDKGSE